MSQLLELARWMCIGFVALVALALILMHLPRSPLKSLAERLLAGIFALLMPVYLVSPIDIVPDVLIPFGLLDDLGVLVAGVAAGRYALHGPQKPAPPTPSPQ